MGQDGAVTFLLNKMDALVSHEYHLLAGIHNSVDELRREFQTIKAFLNEADHEKNNNYSNSYCGQVRVWVDQVRELAYDIEDELDMYTSHAATRFPNFHIRKRRSLAVSVEDINTKLESVRQTRDRYAQLRRPSPDSSQEIGFTDYFDRLASLFEIEPVGIEQSLSELTSWATFNQEPTLKVRFMVGMGGSGKTLMAKKMFEVVRPSFDCSGWVHGSRSQSKELVLRGLLKELFQSRNKRLPPEFHDKMTVLQLMEQLTLFLQNKKYIIVFDDLWSRDLWESIRCALPSSTKKSSRVVITTRRGDIAHFCSDNQSTTAHNLQPLTWSASQELFFRTAFPSSSSSSQGSWIEHCSPELLVWAEKLLTLCEGWPLGVLKIAKYVSRVERTTSAWRQLHDSLGPEMEIGGHLDGITKVLYASYSDLPYYLKSCLLYLSMFPEHYSISRRRLVRMWISEGLVVEEIGKTAEEVGYNYLQDLIHRNLVLVNQVDFDGRAKTCRLHRIIHKIMLSISRDENLFSKVSTKIKANNNYKVRRLSASGSTTISSTGSSFHQVRSLLLFDSQDLSNCTSRSILSLFDILKVLDLEGAFKLDKFPDKIFHLRSLRYLSLRSTSIRELPRWISKLRNLETLDLKHTFVNSVPKKIFKLSKLRHLLIYRYNITVHISIQGFTASESIGKLVSLQKLMCLQVNTDIALLAALKNLTSLKKLGIVELREEDGRHLCSSIESMCNLQSLDVAAIKDDQVLDLHALREAPRLLQRLYLKGKLQKLPQWVSSLHDLVRIGLRWSKLEESPIDALQDLPNLVEIRLLSAYTGKLRN